MGILRFDNKLFYVIDEIRSLILKFISKIINLKNSKIIFLKINQNILEIAAGWDFRVYELTKKYYPVLKEIYTIKKHLFSDYTKEFLMDFTKLKSDNKFLIGLHIRKSDYIKWNKGKFFFEDVTYNKAINYLKIKYKKENKNPYFIVVSDSDISKDIQYDYKINGNWQEDQIACRIATY